MGRGTPRTRARLQGHLPSFIITVGASGLEPSSPISVAWPGVLLLRLSNLFCLGTQSQQLARDFVVLVGSYRLPRQK